MSGTCCLPCIQIKFEKVTCNITFNKPGNCCIAKCLRRLRHRQGHEQQQQEENQEKVVEPVEKEGERKSESNQCEE